MGNVRHSSRAGWLDRLGGWSDDLNGAGWREMRLGLGESQWHSHGNDIPERPTNNGNWEVPPGTKVLPSYRRLSLRVLATRIVGLERERESEPGKMSWTQRGAIDLIRP